MAPCACHPLGSSTMGSRAFALTHGVLATLSPHRRVLCQVLACRWHEGLKCAPADQLLVARLHILLRRPGVIAVGVRPTIITTASPWAAQWACGSSQLESDQQSSQLVSTSHQSGIALVVCDRPTFAHTVTRHSCTTLPLKKCTTSMSPDRSCEEKAGTKIAHPRSSRARPEGLDLRTSRPAEDQAH